MAIGVAVLWGMGFIVAKAGMDHFSPILLMALRFTLTTMCLVWFFRPPLSLFRDLFWVALVSAAIQYSLTFHGLNGIEASTAALLVQLEVPFGLILAWIAFGDKITIGAQKTVLGRGREQDVAVGCHCNNLVVTLEAVHPAERVCGVFSGLAM